MYIKFNGKKLVLKLNIKGKLFLENFDTEQELNSYLRGIISIWDVKINEI